MNARDAVTAAIQGHAPTDAVVVPVAWLVELLSTDAPGVRIDLTGERVAALLGRDPATVGSWCRAGLFPGCYKLNGRQWRIPVAALEAFQRQQQEAAA